MTSSRYFFNKAIMVVASAFDFQFSTFDFLYGTFMYL